MTGRPADSKGKAPEALRRTELDSNAVLEMIHQRKSGEHSPIPKQAPADLEDVESHLDSVKSNGQASPALISLEEPRGYRIVPYMAVFLTRSGRAALKDIRADYEKDYYTLLEKGRVKEASRRGKQFYLELLVSFSLLMCKRLLAVLDPIKKLLR